MKTSKEPAPGLNAVEALNDAKSAFGYSAFAAEQQEVKRGAVVTTKHAYLVGALSLPDGAVVGYSEVSWEEALTNAKYAYTQNLTKAANRTAADRALRDDFEAQRKREKEEREKNDFVVMALPPSGDGMVTDVVLRKRARRPYEQNFFPPWPPWR